jgi:mandelamide amidase
VEKDIADIDKLDRDVDFPMSLYECKRDFAKFFDPYGIKIEDVIAKIGSSDVKASFDSYVLGKDAVTKEAYDEVMTKFRPIMLKAYDDYFRNNKTDFIIIPTTVAPAKPIEGSDETVEINGERIPTFPTYVKNTSPGSDVGVAGISLPIGLTKDGLPVGIELDTRSGNDEALLAAALSLSKVFGPVPAPAGY